MSYEEYLERESLHSSWTRNMFQLITMGVAFLTFFKTNRKLNRYVFVPTTIIFDKEGYEFARILGSIDFNNLEFINWLKQYN